MEAEDIATNSLVKLFNRHSAFSSLDGITAFLYLSTRNESLDYIKKLKRQSENVKNYIALHDAQKPIQDQPEIELVDHLLQALGDLPTQSKKVIRLLYSENLSYAQTADRLEIAKKTVGGNRDYALKLLRTHFRQKGLM